MDKISVKFKSPLDKVSLSSWETYANQLARQKKLKVHVPFLGHLENWYVALRLLVTTWEEQEELVLQWLRFQNGFNISVPTAAGAAALVELSKRLDDAASLSKVACLKAQLLEKTQWAKGKDVEIRAIVFVQQRITAHVLAQWISNDAELRTVGLRAGYVAARNAIITPRLKVTQGQASDCMSRFRAGELNVLVATSVIEEGFDVPKSNVVISFDALKDSVELAQRFGRARQSERRIVAMDERRDRPIERLEQVRREQDVIIQNFEPATARIDPEVELAAQRSREHGARQLLLSLNEDGVEDGESPVATLNLYVKKTKAVCTENAQKQHDGFFYEWTYKTPLRDLRAEGFGANKKAAKTNCAAKLLVALVRDRVAIT